MASNFQLRRILLGARKRLNDKTWISHAYAVDCCGTHCFWGDSRVERFSLLGIIFILTGEETGLRRDVLLHIKGSLPKQYKHIDSFEKSSDLKDVHAFLDDAIRRTYPIYVRPLLWLGIKKADLSSS